VPPQGAPERGTVLRPTACRPRYDGPVGEICRVELRRASSGSYYAALTFPEGLLVARSPTFHPLQPSAADRAASELGRALRALGWRAAGAAWVRESRV
jgi:hypothetical protein